MILKVAIIDDEKHACETLKWQLKQIDMPLKVVGVFQNPIEALTALKENQPDLIFLDIEMPGLNGFQFLEELNLPDVNIVFTTAYDEFALSAFRVNAVDYLIKPVDIDELEAALKRAQTNKERYEPDQLKKLMWEFSKSKTGNVKIGLSSVHGIDFVDCSKILYCQSESNYCRVFLEGGRKILASKTLKDIEELLPENLFCRVHNSYIINLSKVVSYLHKGGGTLLIQNDVEIKVSRSKKKELLERLEEF